MHDLERNRITHPYRATFFGAFHNSRARDRMSRFLSNGAVPEGVGQLGVEPPRTTVMRGLMRMYEDADTTLESYGM